MTSDITLIIPAWRRPHYLAAALTSWHRARGASRLHRIAIALADDPAARPGMLAIVADAASHGMRPEIWTDTPEATQVHGPHRAIGEAIISAFGDPACGFVIVSDEDVTVSDDVLDYVAYARGLDVDAVCCHSNLGQGWSPEWDDTAAAQDVVRVEPEFTGWTWGIPRRTWDRVFGPEWDWDESSGPVSTEHGFDWQCHRLANRGLRVAIPDASRAQNIGQHGGVYALPHMFERTQAKSYREHRDPVAYRLEAGQQELLRERA